jgi:ferredoxin-thioredoxin reductase catalytic subunit
MLASLRISKVEGRKFDKKETAELAKRHGADVQALRLTKKLFTNSDAYKAINTAGSHLREIFNRWTLPWDNDGTRILTSASFFDATTEIRQGEREFNAALPPFFEQYPLLKARDKVLLNGLYREEDYPTLEKLKKKFSVKMEFTPLPSSSDFRANLRDEDVAAIKKNIEETVTARIELAMEEPYRRLLDGVAHMASRLQGEKTCPCRRCVGKEYATDEFKDSLVDNLREMVQVLPKLNLTDDSNLAFMIEQVETALTPFSADSIRASDQVRKTLARRAMDIQNQMAGYFSAVA